MRADIGDQLYRPICQMKLFLIETSIQYASMRPTASQPASQVKVKDCSFVVARRIDSNRGSVPGILAELITARYRVRFWKADAGCGLST